MGTPLPASCPSAGPWETCSFITAGCTARGARISNSRCRVIVRRTGLAKGTAHSRAGGKGCEAAGEHRTEGQGGGCCSHPPGSAGAGSALPPPGEDGVGDPDVTPTPGLRFWGAGLPASSACPPRDKTRAKVCGGPATISAISSGANVTLTARVFYWMR